MQKLIKIIDYTVNPLDGQLCKKHLLSREKQIFKSGFRMTLKKKT